MTEWPMGAKVRTKGKVECVYVTGETKQRQVKRGVVIDRNPIRTMIESPQPPGHFFVRHNDLELLP